MALFSTPASGGLWMRSRSVRRVAVVLGVVALAPASLAQAAPMVGGPLPQVKIWPGPATQTTASVPGANATKPGVTAAQKAAVARAAKPYQVPKTSWPTGSATIALAPAATATSSGVKLRPGTARQAGSLPVALAGADAATAPAKSASVSFASRAAVQAAGINGVIVTVARADGSSAPSATQVSLDYAAFAGAYGGGYADRLKLVELPACALTTPQLAKCRVQTPVKFTNDIKNGTLTATVPVGANATTAQSTGAKAASQESAMVLAATSGASGSVGTYTATSLSPAGTWSAGGSSGGFTYSYAISVPPTVGGSAPDVTLGYDSASVDGRTSVTNAQASWIGDGWDYSPGYIERSYQPCSQDTDATAHSSDLCWAGNIVTLSLGGHSGALVRDDTAPNTWRLQNDDGTKVIALTGANNGAWKGEAWEIITPDGTAYYFGENHLPGGSGSDAATQSAWTEPVYCPDSGDTPDAGSCYNSTDGKNSFVSNMAWHWNLDYVVDPHGNLQTYNWVAETNYYQRGYDGGANAGTSTLYTRGGNLSTISYGYRLSDAISGTKPTSTVTFNVGERCAPGYANCNYAYLTSHLSDSTTTSNWPDTPTDLICPTSSYTCTNYSPSFFETDQLQSIVTSVLVGSTPDMVDTYTLAQDFPSPQNGIPSDPTKDEVCSPNCGDGSVAVMWLQSITHQGNDTLGGGTAASTPAVTFVPDMMQNRVDGTTTGYAALYRPRMDSITTETGAQIVVSYDITTAQNCSSTNMPASPDTDTLFCYQQYWSPASGPVADWFNIYPVSEVTINDLVAPAAWSEAQITQYSYTGPAYHRDDSPLIAPVTTANPVNERTWDQFRGFRTVTTTTGVAGAEDVPTKSVTTYMQGMDGDYKSDGTQRSVTIPDTVGDNVTDSNWLQGQALETDSYLGTSSIIEKKSVNGLWTYATTGTEGQAESMPAVTSKMMQASKSRSYQLWHDATWKRTETDTAYDSSGRVVTSDAKGDGTAAVPEVCTTTSYATSTSTTPNMIAYPDEVKGVQGACGTTATAANTVADTESFYDDSTALGTLSGAGNVTQTQAVDSYNSSGVPQYVPESKAGYDAYGRTTSATDADGYTSITAYTAPGASPDTVTVTNPMGWSATTTLDPARNLAIAATDVNGELTSKTYDGLGRVTKVWSPLHAKASSAPADETYAYAVSNNTVPTTVTTEKLRDDGSYAPTVAFYDGSLRPIQTQAPTADGETGRLITDTHYNSLGQSVKTTIAYYNSASGPISIMYNPYANGGNDSAIPEETETFYDGLGRTVQALTVAQGINQWSTTTAYKGVDEIDVTPPSGGTATSAFTDALGRTVQSWTYTTATPTGSASNATVTTYTYTPAGKPATMTDTVGDAWAWTYDLHGRQIKAVEPSTGTTTSTFDRAGNPLSSTDARGITLSYTYDALGRKRAEFNTTGGAGETSADEQASWTYDTLAKGQPTSSARYTDGATDTTQTYTETVRGYTALYQSEGVQVTIPSAQGTLAGTYKDYQSYTPETSMLTQDYYYPEGNLPQETVNLAYDLSGLITGFGGTEVYMNTATYNPYGQILQTNFGPYGEQLTQNETYDTDTGRQLTATDSLQTSTTGPIDDTTYTYDQAGLITSESNLQAGNTTPDTQCFTYDHQDRLTAAYTDTAAVTTTTGSNTAQIFGIGGCADTTPTAGKITGGPAPYAQTYSYDALGDRVAETQLNTTTAAISTTETLAYSSYNASTATTSAAATPDAVQKVTTTTPTGTATATYGYNDGNGDTSTRTVTTTGTITASPSQAIAYDAEGHTKSVTNTATGTASTYLYDAGGTLLLQHDPASNQATLYLPFGEEIYLNTGNGAITGNRYITASPDGTTIVHAGSGAISYEATDAHHTATVEIAAANLAVTNRYYDPYGNPRGTVPTTWPDSHSYLGQPQDQTTGLDLLGARQYDPATGRFLSVDPVLESGDQRQMNGYSYSGDNPVNSSDPNGLNCVSDDNGGCLRIPKQPSGGNPGTTPPTTNDTTSCSNGVINCDPTKFDEFGIGLVNVQETDPSYAALLAAYMNATFSTKYKSSYNADQYETLVWANACATIRSVCGFEPGSLGFAINLEYMSAWVNHAGPSAPAFKPLLVQSPLNARTAVQLAVGIVGTVWSAKGITTYLPKNPLSPAPETTSSGPSQIEMPEGSYTLTYTTNEDGSWTGSPVPEGYSDPAATPIPMPYGGPSTNPINEWTIGGLPKTWGGQLMDSVKDILQTDWGANNPGGE